MLCAGVLGFMGCASKKAQNELRWDYKSFLNTKKVDSNVVHNTVWQVLADENIPGFATQLKNKYAIETEWLSIRRGRGPDMAPDSRVLSAADTRYPVYIKYFLVIDKKGYTISAIANYEGVQWVSYDQSYKPAALEDVMPQTEYGDALISLSNRINVSLKARIDGGRFAESLSNGF
jgi:hypothetical protein